MVISRLPSGGGGSKELHGASINVSTSKTSLAGATVELYLVNGSAETKIAEGKFDNLALEYTFKDIQVSGTYKAKCGSIENTTIVQATDILNKKVLTIILETKVYLYNKGDMCISLTGGWSTCFANGVTNIFNASNMVLNSTKVVESEGGVSNANGHLIDLTNYSKLYVKWSGVFSGSYDRIKICVSNAYMSDYSSLSSAAIKQISAGDGTVTVTECDISAKTGGQYVALCTNRGANAVVTEIWIDE